ncbi:substrate-binding domain-containing protein, partial [Vibrio sp. 10N.286.49.E1]
GGYMATKHLIDNGHSDIGCITGPLHRNQASSRYQGYKQAMEEANLEINPKWIVESNFECDGGFDSYQALKAGGQMPSALFVSND